MTHEAIQSSADQVMSTGLSKAVASTLINRNVTVAGHRTSMRLEPLMWDALHQLCRRENKSLNEVVTEIDRQRSESSLTAAIRVHLLRYFAAAATDEGHRIAGHGGTSRAQLPL
jgi:predicted DNA-binding ribbon-helix-helix protein